MSKPSPLSDDVDPAPRILRIIASGLGQGAVRDSERAKLAQEFRRWAEVLEGKLMSNDEANTQHGRVLSRERRSPDYRRGKVNTALWEKVEQPKPRTGLNEADERFRRRLEEQGKLPARPVAGA